MKKLKFIFALILILTGLTPGQSVSAQTGSEQGPQMEVTAAYQGYFKYGEWLPVWVELENQGKDIEAEIRVEVSGSQGTTVFTAPVSLPSGSRKRLPVYVLPNNFSRQIKVNLVSKDNVILSKTASVKPQPNISFFIGLIAPERGALGLLNGIALPGQDRPRVIADLTLADIADRPEALRSFDVLVLNNTDTSQITPEQVAALEYWVQSGGRLVIGGGPAGLQTVSGLPESLMPVQVQNTIEIGTEVLPDLARYAGASEIEGQQTFIASFAVPGEGYLLAGKEELPLVYERLVGNGTVDFVALDLSGVPFNGWPGTQNFWETLISPGSAYPENMPFDVSIRQMRANQLGYALSNIPALDLPSIQGLSILLGIYILFVGPLNYLLLRRLRKLHLAWVTIPILTLLFTGGAFGLGYALRGNDLIMNKIALVQVQPGGDASVTSYLGLFSPRQQSYEIMVEGQGLVSPMSGYDPGPWGGGGLPTGGGEMVFQQGSPSIVKGLTVNQFSMQSFVSEETWNDFGSISGDLRLENDTLVGTVKNDTAYPLTDVVIIIQSRFARLGDLGPGQETEVNLGLGNLQSNRFGPPISYALYQDEMQVGPTPRSIELKINILSAVLDNNQSWSKLISSNISATAGTTSAVRNNPVQIIGWLNQAPPNVEVRNNRISQQATALVFTSLNYQLPNEGAVTLPIGMIPGNLSRMPREGGPCGPNGMASVSMGRGEAEFEFQLPTEVSDLKIRSLKLNLWRDSGGDWGLPEISFWSWQDEAWNSIQNPIMGINVIEQPDVLVNENGTIRVRVISNSDMYSCYYLDLGLDGEYLEGNRGIP